MTVTIWVVCHNALELTDRCLRAVFRTAPGVPVMVWDNNSIRDVLLYLKAFETQGLIRLYRSERNVGCVEARNALFQDTTTDLFASIDNDLFLAGGWLEAMVSRFEQNPRLALCGMEGMPTELGPDGVGRLGKRVDYVGGGACMGRVSILRETGLFRPELFKMAYCEDADLGLRVQGAGYDIETAPVDFWHVGRGTWRNMTGDLEKRIRAENHRTLRRLWWPELRALNVDHQ